ncbi:hypothetical protein [Idiomarina sp. H2]|uniref:hypothetical protein n=1 Tax=Idiomarina sp. H2 TaxID=2183987 RepID=UPI00105C3B2B|nr:hypothetical protein [Idiomarina sp. H2]TDS21117.1 hypothetical protein DET62_109130 [Idiomarina sp. H2]
MNDFLSFIGLILKFFTAEGDEPDTNEDFAEGGGGQATFYDPTTGDFEARSPDDPRVFNILCQPIFHKSM